MHQIIFTAQHICIAQTMQWQDVCLSVHPSHAGIVCKCYTYPQSFFHHRVAHHSSFPIPNGMSIFRREPPNGGKGGMKKITIFDQYRALPRN